MRHFFKCRVRIIISYIRLPLTRFPFSFSFFFFGGKWQRKKICTASSRIENGCLDLYPGTENKPKIKTLTTHSNCIRLKIFNENKKKIKPLGFRLSNITVFSVCCEHTGAHIQTLFSSFLFLFCFDQKLFRILFTLLFF